MSPRRITRNHRHDDTPPARRARPHRHKARTGDRTRNQRAWRITGTWTDRGRPLVIPTQDRRRRDKVARDLARQGAHVLVEEHTGYGMWCELYALAPEPASQLVEQ